MTKIFKGISFEGVWGQLESRKVFQRKSVTGSVRLTLVFMLKSTLWERFRCNFSEVFGSIKKFSFSAAKLDTGLLFYAV